MTAEEITLTILKWIFIVFVAGFIGYFGKYLSKRIIARIHKKGPEAKQAPSIEVVKTKYGYKLEKKKLKVEKKKQKKHKKKRKAKKKR